MDSPILELEGTWEEIKRHDSELQGKHVRLTATESTSASAEDNPAKRMSTARDLLRFAGIWEGDDLQERLREVYATRSKAQF